MNQDLTQGAPGRVLWRFCLPLFGSILFQQLYNIADSLVAGKFVGENALAAVGNSYEVTLIFLAFAFGCNIGCSVIVSRFFGGGKYAVMKTAVFTTLISGVVLCAVLMVSGFTLGSFLLKQIHTPTEIFKDSLLYLNIYILGLPFLFFYNIATGIFSALGDSKTPFFFLAASSLSNIAMDIWFVTTFRMGVAGVAWATFLCQSVSCLLALAFVLKRLASIKTKEPVSRFSWPIFGQIARIAVPSILQQSFISAGNIILQGVINRFGAGVIAGYSASVKLNNLVVTSFTTLGNGISNYTAQNIGAGKLPRIRQGFKAGVSIVWLLCLPLVFAYFFFGSGLMRLFMDRPTQTAVETGAQFLKILSPFYFVVSVKLIADGILRGAGHMGKFMTATFTDLILRVILAVLLSGLLKNPVGIWYAWPVGWSTATVLSVYFYRRGPWHENEPLKTPASPL
ncbi:MAG: MATE family efflux transporter [Lachnospiraceae bacterium]|nr:MATE family efflux transporter [Lachnospiraceae bacterium]